MRMPTQQLLELLDLSVIDTTHFRGQSVRLLGTRIFGGQILAQAIMAAAKTCNRPVHSLHGYFIRPSHSDFPIEYHVTTLRDGYKFSLRQVYAYQSERLIFSALISMSTESANFDFQCPPPPYPVLPPMLEQPSAIHFHLQIEPQPSHDTTAYYEYAKTYEVLTQQYDTQLYHQAIAAYYSDYNLLNMALKRLNLSEHTADVMSASLDHSLYFHRKFRVDAWMLYQLHCSTAQDGRGLNQGQLWQNNQLICTAVKESLIRCF